MARNFEQLNTYSILSLVASDFSYKPSDIIRELPNPFTDTLKSFPDSRPADERSFPTELVRGLRKTGVGPRQRFDSVRLELEKRGL